MELNDFENRMVHDGKRNNREVKVICAFCGGESWQRWQRVKKKLKNGSKFFCCPEHFQEWYREEGKKTWGKENANFHWDKSRQCWYAYWKDMNGKQRSTTRARWLWEKEYGKLKRNQVVTYIDGNPKNCDLDNLKTISRSESNSIHLQGHEVSDETKEKLSDAHSGKVLSREHKLKIGNSLRQRWASGEFDGVHVGENSPRWRGGVPKKYPSEFSNSLKEEIKERDNYKCRICSNGNDRLEVHHIDGNRENNNSENLLTLCFHCHHLIHDNIETSDPVIFAFRSIFFNGGLTFD